MAEQMSRDEIADIVIRDVLWDGMQLEEMGHSLDEIAIDTEVIGDNGLGFDSVDLLEIVVQIQKRFGIKIGEVGSHFFEVNLKTVRTIVDYVGRSEQGLQNQPEQ